MTWNEDCSDPPTWLAAPAIFFSTAALYGGFKLLVRLGTNDLIWHPYTNSAGDLPCAFGVFLHSSRPRWNSSDEISPVLATNPFMAFTAASATVLLCGYNGVDNPGGLLPTPLKMNDTRRSQTAVRRPISLLKGLQGLRTNFSIE